MSLVTVRSYRDVVDAELARASLESAGIAAVVHDQYLVGMQWLYSRAIGGVKVKVDHSQLDAARAVLREDRSGDLPTLAKIEGASEAEGCPVCGSTEVHPSRVQRNSAALSLATGLPFIAWRRRWVCDICHHAWKPGRASEAVPAETLEAERRVHERRPYPVLRTLLVVAVGFLVIYHIDCQLRRVVE